MVAHLGCDSRATAGQIYQLLPCALASPAPLYGSDDVLFCDWYLVRPTLLYRIVCPSRVLFSAPERSLGGRGFPQRNPGGARPCRHGSDHGDRERALHRRRGVFAHEHPTGRQRGARRNTGPAQPQSSGKSGGLSGLLRLHRSKTATCPPRDDCWGPLRRRTRCSRRTAPRAGGRAKSRDREGISLGDIGHPQFYLLNYIFHI